MTLGERVRAARRDRHMTLASLSEASKLSKGFISQIESGRSTPSLSSLRRIAAALSIPVPALVSDLHALDPGREGPTLFTTGSVRGSPPAISSVPLGAGQLSLVALSPGSGLVGAPVAGERLGRAACFVHEGTVAIETPGGTETLHSGEGATLDSDAPYILEQRGDRLATILLSLPPGVPIPKLKTTTAPVRHPRLPPEVEADSAFRLVAMRVHRGESHER